LTGRPGRHALIAVSIAISSHAASSQAPTTSIGRRNQIAAKWSNAAHPTDAEAQGIWAQTVSYCATWGIDSTGREFVYQLGANMSPNLIGAERRRRFTLDGDRLILYPAPLPAGVVEWTVEWRKASGSRRP